MRQQYSLSEFIIKKSFYFSVWLIEQFNNVKTYEQKLARLRDLPNGTLGRDVANCLDENRLRLVPKYESHDLKHTLLDFNMTPLDEIRMQAFMLGNGNYSLPCVAILVYGMFLLPNKWKLFLADYKAGSKSLPISTWKLEDYAHLQSSDLKFKIGSTEQKKFYEFDWQYFSRIAATVAMIAGVFGMVFCLPFLFSNRMEDLVGAGFPFIGGAILAVGGLIALTNLTKSQSIKVA